MLMVSAAICAGAQTLSPTKIVSTNSDNYSLSLAIDGTKRYPANVEIANLKTQGNNKTGDLKFTIYGEDFSTIAQFTVANMYKNSENAFSNVYGIETNGYDISDIILTKGVFTTDGKWCFVYRDGNRNSDCNYYVYNQDGTKLCNLTPLRTGDYSDYYFSFGAGEPYGKPYLTVVTQNSMGSDPTLIEIYTFTGNGGVSAPALASRRLVSYPNPLPQGHTLTIELPREASQGTFVTFSDMNGRMLDRCVVEEGKSLITVSPRHMSRGAYIYTVYYGDGEVSSGRLLAE